MIGCMWWARWRQCLFNCSLCRSPTILNQLVMDDAKATVERAELYVPGKERILFRPSERKSLLGKIWTWCMIHMISWRFRAERQCYLWSSLDAIVTCFYNYDLGFLLLEVLLITEISWKFLNFGLDSFFDVRMPINSPKNFLLLVRSQIMRVIHMLHCELLNIIYFCEFTF